MNSIGPRKSSGRGTGYSDTDRCLSFRPAYLPVTGHCFAVGLIRLCALQLSGRRDRERQRGVLSGATPVAGHTPHRRAELAAVAYFLLRALQQQERRLAAKVERERVVTRHRFVQSFTFPRHHRRFSEAGSIINPENLLRETGGGSCASYRSRSRIFAGSS